MASEQFVLRFDAETTGLISKIDQMIAKFREVGAELKFLGDGAGIGSLAKDQEQYTKKAQESLGAIRALKSQLAELRRAEAEFAKTGATRVGGAAGKRVSDIQGRGYNNQFTAIGGTGAGKGRGIEGITAAIREVESALAGARQGFQALNTQTLQNLQNVAKLIPGYDGLLRNAVLREDAEARTNQLLSQQSVVQAVVARQKAATARLAELEDQKAEIESSLQAQQPDKLRKAIQQAGTDRDTEERQLKAAEKALENIDALGRRIAARSGKRGAGLIQGIEAKDIPTLRKALEDLQGVSTGRASKDVAKVTEEIGKYEKAIRKASEARKSAERGERKAAQYREGAGGVPALKELDEAITATKAKIAEAYGDDAAQQLFPTLDDDMLALRDTADSIDGLSQSMEHNQKALSGMKKGTKEYRQLNDRMKNDEKQLADLMRRRQQLLDKMQQYISRPADAGLPQAQTPEQMKQALVSQMPPLARLFTNIFSDMQRRFIATFQFAISGALIFGTIRMVKEFVQTAIEVERAFADIESAMEFDISDARGTAEFDMQVENVRQRVLALANDYNVLPTEANKAAFVMVSRFKDVDNAMAATRAQLLATKISTIDQAETLRALTAVAEGFAAAELELNESMSLNERLMKREAVSAQLYMKALDLAVYVQQKFGVEVEDTLEGTARATEVFRQMGFTMEETASIVAATSRELGQTGQQAAERLNRSLGQLTDPKIRDALLDLASSSEDFSLSIADFGSGAQAWETITRQFQSLEKSSPTVARQILQIVGQRRELEAVAAALGTTDLQQEILAGASTAAGAAENRFTFLSRTVAELIESVKVGFQELAQNFERLGGLSSLRLLVTSFDILVASLNEVLRAAVDLKLFLDDLFSIGNKGLGTMIVQFGSLALAIGGVVKVVQSLQIAVAGLTGTKLFAQLAPIFAVLGPGKHIANAVSAATTAGATGFAASAANPKILGAAALGMAGSIKTSSAAMLAAIPVWGQIAAVIAGTVYSVRSLNESIESLAESAKAGDEILREGEAEREKQITEEGLTGEEAERFRLEGLLADLRELESISDSAMPSIASRFGAILTDLDNLTGGAENRPTSFRDTQIFQAWERYSDPASIEGAEEYFNALADEVERQLVEQGRDTLRRRAATLDLPQSLTEGQRQDLGLPGGAVPQDALARVYSLLDQSLTAEAYGDDAGAKALADAAAREYDRVMGIFGLLPGQLERSVGDLKAEVEGFDTQFQLGRITRDAVSAGLAANAALLRQNAQSGLDAGSYTEEEYKELIRLADDWLLQSIDSKVAGVTEAIEAGSRPGEGTIEALNREIAVLEAAGAQQEGISRAEKELHKQYLDKLEEVAIAELEFALQLAEQAIAEAVGYQAVQAAKAERNRILGEIADQAREFGDEAKASATESTIRVNERAAAREASDIAKQVAIARQRQRGPILNSINALRAQLVGINADLASGYLNPGEAAALVVQKNEIIAQIAQAEQAEIRAYAEAMLSTRNAMKANQLELTMLARELALTARIFGQGSVEWSNVKKAMNQVQAALMGQALELESIQRLMEGDLTDPYFKTQMALVDAIQRQRAVYADADAGDLEKARADLEVMEAEIADQAAFAQDRLFTLKFDLDRGAITKGQYIANLKKFRDEVDTSSRAGKELWQEITGLIEGMEGDLGDMQFNIPGEIRLPTLFEVRRSLAADALGVNYQDNRQQDIRIFVDSDVDIAKVADAVNEGLGSQAASASARYAPGSSTITLGI